MSANESKNDRHELTEAFADMLGDGADPDKVNQALKAATITLHPPSEEEEAMMAQMISGHFLESKQ